MTPTVIIGAGPAGLATAALLHERGLPFTVVERRQQVAPRWRDHYDRLRLHTVKDLSALPGRVFPDDAPRYVPRDMLVDYYEQYAAQFGIEPRFGVTVERIERRGSGWAVITDDGELESDDIVIATGANRVPVQPEFAGAADFRGRLVPAADYRNPTPFVGEDVLVVGMGNTGAEIALDLSEAGIQTTISVRSPVNIVPRDVLGRPTQLTARALDRLPNAIGDRIGVLLRRLTVGDLSAYGIETPELPPAAQLREHGKTPVIDVGTIDAIRHGRILVMPGIERLTSDGVTFDGGARMPFDSIITATGYRPALDALVRGIEPFLDAAGMPRGPVGTGAFTGLHFVGFNTYVTGGILGTIAEDATRVVEAIADETDD